jgi:glycosyltransferase involved in cell wall biosynthesis
MNSARISVIIPTYNMGWCIERAIQSVIGQNVDDLEIIVVDDGSTDDTASRLRKFGKQIIVICQPNRGLSAARNIGIKKASGEFLAFLDADDQFRPKKLTSQRAYLSAKSDCGAVFSDGYLVSPTGVLLNLISAESPHGLFAVQDPADLRRYLFRGHPFPTHSALVRKSCVIAAGLFDESMRAREDLDFWLRLSASYPICYLPGEMVNYTVRADSMSRSSELMHAHSSSLYDRILAFPDFKILSNREKAMNLRAWAIEVGVLHHGPWTKNRSRAKFYACKALGLDPLNWKSWILPCLLASSWSIKLTKLTIQSKTKLSRLRFTSDRSSV